MLFDLDGTLIDSAPDLAGACNEMRARARPRAAALRAIAPDGRLRRARHGRRRRSASHPSDPDYLELRDEFLARYEARMTRETTRLRRDGAGARVARARRRCPGESSPTRRRASPRRWSRRSACAERPRRWSAATPSPHAKPHPAPLLEAARRLGLAAGDCVYVGDDRRDVEAGRAAGMAHDRRRLGLPGRGRRARRPGAPTI